MFSLFKFFRKSSKESTLKPAGITQLEMNVCSWLQNHLNKLKRKWLYMYFLLILSIYALASLSAIRNAFSRTPFQLNVESVKIPTHIGRAESIGQFKNETYKDQSNHIQLFIHSIDSIKHNHPAAFDSIRQKRPGLLDSLQFLKSAIK